MKIEEAAKLLRAAGWTVTEPITQENCEHPAHMMRGSLSQGSNGSGYSDSTCLRCGKRWEHRWEGPPNAKTVWLQN